MYQTHSIIVIIIIIVNIRLNSRHPARLNFILLPYFEKSDNLHEHLIFFVRFTLYKTSTYRRLLPACRLIQTIYTYTCLFR